MSIWRWVREHIAFTFPSKALVRLLYLIVKKQAIKFVLPTLTWVYDSTANCFAAVWREINDSELLKYKIHIGVQSYHGDTLDRLPRKTDGFWLRNSFRLCRWYAFRMKLARWRNARLNWGRSTRRAEATALTVIQSSLPAHPSRTVPPRLSSSIAKITSKRTRSSSLNRNRNLWLQR